MRDPSETPTRRSPDRESAPIRSGLGCRVRASSVGVGWRADRERVGSVLAFHCHAPRDDRVHPGGRASTHGFERGKTLQWGPCPIESSPTTQHPLSPPRRRRCAQVRNVSISVATTSHAPQVLFRVHVDQHPTHHPPPTPNRACRLAETPKTPRARRRRPTPRARAPTTNPLCLTALRSQGRSSTSTKRACST